jgi:hypothetical protein
MYAEKEKILLPTGMLKKYDMAVQNMNWALRQKKHLHINSITAQQLSLTRTKDKRKRGKASCLMNFNRAGINTIPAF